MTVSSQPLFDGSEWNFQTMDRTYAAIEEVAVEDLGLDIYPNQIGTRRDFDVRPRWYDGCSNWNGSIGKEMRLSWTANGDGRSVFYD